MLLYHFLQLPVDPLQRVVEDHAQPLILLLLLALLSPASSLPLHAAEVLLLVGAVLEGTPLSGDLAGAALRSELGLLGGHCGRVGEDGSYESGSRGGGGLGGGAATMLNRTLVHRGILRLVQLGGWNGVGVGLVNESRAVSGVALVPSDGSSGLAHVSFGRG